MEDALTVYCPDLLDLWESLGWQAWRA